MMRAAGCQPDDWLEAKEKVEKEREKAREKRAAREKAAAEEAKREKAAQERKAAEVEAERKAAHQEWERREKARKELEEREWQQAQQQQQRRSGGRNHTNRYQCSSCGRSVAEHGIAYMEDEGICTDCFDPWAEVAAEHRRNQTQMNRQQAQFQMNDQFQMHRQQEARQQEARQQQYPRTTTILDDILSDSDDYDDYGDFGHSSYSGYGGRSSSLGGHSSGYGYNDPDRMHDVLSGLSDDNIQFTGFSMGGRSYRM